MIWAMLILLAAAGAVPFILESRRKGVTEAERRAAPGQFAALSQGVTHSQWYGPARGPVAVAIHGLTTPSPVWAELAEGLGQTGYRVLVYDLYGRGLSDAPKGAQDAAFHIRQLNDLLADQGLSQDLTLLGYSMGGAIATAFTAAHPERVKRLILLAPVGMGQPEDGFVRFVRQTPLLGDWLFLALAGWQMRRAMAAEPNAMTPVQLAELEREGYLPAILSSIRGMLQVRLEAEHRAIGRADVPVVALWGDADKTVPLSGLGTLAQWNRNARQEVIAGAGHSLTHTHAPAVLEVLKDVLRER
jgi:pimeloyl-ACP methyl ester carboxylesterase